ncbi:MAG TPA: glutamate racemase [Daejeonella sp.]|nr:glutamate racemase [Daejeonella sp.]
MSSALPIGIFDSGIGGLTVASAIHKLLPQEQLVYFGDTAHLPYGDKSPVAIKYYSLKIAQFLIEQGCKMIVIACNTASSHAYQDLLEVFGQQVPIVNVIDPVVDEVVKAGIYHRIGVIGTKATIKSEVYAKKLKAADAGLKVSSLATPLLAPMIEEGFFNNTISHTVIHSYLSSPVLKNIDSLILACTHYPLIKPEIEEFYQSKVSIVNTAETVARHVQQRLQQLNLLNSENKALHRFYVSDYTSSFERSTRMFFGEKIHLRHKAMWETTKP